MHHNVSLFAEVAFHRTGERLKRSLAQKACRGTVYLTHQQIADDLGTLREVVSRLLKDFEQRGFVRFSRGVVQLTQQFYGDLV